MVIVLQNVYKSYGALAVLRGVELEIPRGEAFGLLGPNGAGKSTLIHSILGFLRPDDGVIRVLGTRDLERVAGRLGYLPERTYYHTQFTAHEYLRTLGKLSNLRGERLRTRIETVLDQVGIEAAADRRIGTYSKGMLQRLGLAQALLHEPEILIVDEPTSGLDPGGQRDMAQMLARLRNEGHTLLVCTHQLTEVARLCDRVGVLVNGRLDRVTGLRELEAQGQSMTIRVNDLPSEAADALEQLSPFVRCTRTTVVIFPNTPQLQREAVQVLLNHRVHITTMQPAADALEQFYLQAVEAGPTDIAPPADADGTDDELLERLVGGHRA